MTAEEWRLIASVTITSAAVAVVVVATVRALRGDVRSAWRAIKQLPRTERRNLTRTIRRGEDIPDHSMLSAVLVARGMAATLPGEWYLGLAGLGLGQLLLDPQSWLAAIPAVVIVTAVVGWFLVRRDRRMGGRFLDRVGV